MHCLTLTVEISRPTLARSVTFPLTGKCSEDVCVYVCALCLCDGKSEQKRQCDGALALCSYRPETPREETQHLLPLSVFINDQSPSSVLSAPEDALLMGLCLLGSKTIQFN